MTRVRLTTGDKYPQHGPRQNKNTPMAKGGWGKWRGTWVDIGKPIEPRGWSCDTDVIWPVLNAQCFTHPPEASEEIAYVCRHQIEAGD